MKRQTVQVGTEAHRAPLKAFADAMDETRRLEGWRDHEALKYFLHAGARAIRGRTLNPDGGLWRANEDEYMKIVASCRNPKETMLALREMMRATTAALEADAVDFIGPIFSEIASSAGLGQFFTPPSLCKLMAMMSVGDAADYGDRMTFHEPACGVAGMVLATNAVLRDRGVDVARCVHWTMVDVDFTAVCGAYLQTALTGCSASVIHGNTLTLAEWFTGITPAALLYWTARRDHHAAAPATPNAPVQLSLL